MVAIIHAAAAAVVPQFAGFGLDVNLDLHTVPISGACVKEEIRREIYKIYFEWNELSECLLKLLQTRHCFIHYVIVQMLLTCPEAYRH